jgi:RNA polymerase sigma-70 factor (ECF subfamily)
MVRPTSTPPRLVRDFPDVEAAPPVGPAAHPLESRAFQQLVLAHLDAAHNLAWWLTRNDHDAAEVVQDACLLAWRSFDGFRDGDARSWLLAIVRHAAYSRLRRGDLDLAPDAGEDVAGSDPGPLGPLLQKASAGIVQEALYELATPHREILVLSDVEGLTYEQIGRVLRVPVGTVMSRLSRARDALRRMLLPRLKKE